MTSDGELLESAEEGSAGFALIVVIAFLLIFSSFLGAFAVSAHIKALTGATRLSDFRLQTTAQAITAMIAVKLARDQVSSKVPIPSFAHCSLGDFDVDIGIQPHSGLISLNLASEETIRDGLDALGIALDDQMALAKAIVEFRYPGGSSNELSPVALVGGYKHAPFEDIMELTDFKPLEGIPAWRLAQVFSVYAPSAVPASETLSPSLRSKRGFAGSEQPRQQSSALVGAATVEATVQEGDRKFYAATIFDAGSTSTPHAVASIPWDHLSTPPGEPDNPSLCTVTFDAKDIRLLNGVPQ